MAVLKGVLADTGYSCRNGLCKNWSHSDPENGINYFKSNFCLLIFRKQFFWTVQHEHENMQVY